MILLLTSTLIAILIPLALLFIAIVLRARIIKDREKSTPFECGFDPKTQSRIPFSTRFFLLAIIFIVFDIEIVLLIPIPTIILLCNKYTNIIIPILFLIILVVGLFHEWNEGALDWSN